MISNTACEKEQFETVSSCKTMNEAIWSWAMSLEIFWAEFSIFCIMWFYVEMRTASIMRYPHEHNARTAMKQLPTYISSTLTMKLHPILEQLNNTQWSRMSRTTAYMSQPTLISHDNLAWGESLCNRAWCLVFMFMNRSRSVMDLDETYESLQLMLDCIMLVEMILRRLTSHSIEWEELASNSVYAYLYLPDVHHLKHEKTNRDEWYEALHLKWYEIIEVSNTVESWWPRQRVQWAAVRGTVSHHKNELCKA